MSGRIRMFLKPVMLMLCGLLLLVGAFAAHEWYAKPFFIGNLFNRVFVQYLWDRPEDLSVANSNFKLPLATEIVRDNASSTSSR